MNLNIFLSYRVTERNVHRRREREQIGVVFHRGLESNTEREKEKERVREKEREREREKERKREKE